MKWGRGPKGPLTARFAARRVCLRHGRGERWVLFERLLASDERKYDVLNLEPIASLKTLVRVARSRLDRRPQTAVGPQRPQASL